MWYHRMIGKERCPIVDTWWQTETGAIMITPLPGVTATKPGSATVPFPGIRAALLDAAGNEMPGGRRAAGASRIRGRRMLRTIWGDDQRYVDTYFSKWPGRPDLYFPGDGAKRDDDGYYWILGRVDDVLNVAGHRIGTMEVESALVDHPSVAEAAVVGKAHELKGQAIAAFVTLRAGFHRQRPICVTNCASTSHSRSARSPGRTTSCSAPTCRRRARARSCGGCCETSPKGARWATPRRWRTRAWWRASRISTRRRSRSHRFGAFDPRGITPSGSPLTAGVAVRCAPASLPRKARTRRRCPARICVGR